MRRNENHPGADGNQLQQKQNDADQQRVRDRANRAKSRCRRGLRLDSRPAVLGVWANVTSLQRHRKSQQQHERLRATARIG